MNKDTWALIRGNKNFNIRVFRRGTIVLIVSLVLNCILGLLIHLEYKKLPQPEYYETNGITEPMKLKPLNAPNRTSVPLLEPDQPPESEEKILPPD